MEKVERVGYLFTVISKVTEAHADFDGDRLMFQNNKTITPKR